MPVDSFARIFDGRRQTITFDHADKLFCRFDLNMHWRDDPELHKLYWPGGVPPNLMLPCKCANPYCLKGGWFAVPEWDGPTATATKHQRYCDKACQQHHYNIRTEVVRAPETRATECSKGHLYSKWGIYVTPNGTHVCRRCRALAKQRYDRRPDVKARKAAALRARRREAVAA